MRLKKNLVKMMNQLNQKADKRLAGCEAAESNISQITQLMLELAKSK